MTKMFRATEESGRSMVEMLGVLAIVGVLSIGGITGYSKAMAKYKVNKTLDQVSMLITNIRTTFGNQVSYYGLTNAMIVNYGLVENDLTQGKTDGTLKNSYQGAVSVAAADCDNTDATYCPAFSISFDELPASACVTILSSDWGGSSASGLVSITVNTAAATTGGTEFKWGATSNKLPISASDALTSCQESTGNEGKGKLITWKYN